jgi:outer membrane protein assembly factor BamB
MATPAVSDSFAFFAPGDDDRNVYAVKISNGEVLWASAGTAKRTEQEMYPADGSVLAMLRLKSPSDRAAGIAALQKQGVQTARRVALGKKASGTPADFLPLEGGVKTSSVAVDGSRVYVIQREQGYSSDINLTPLSRFILIAIDKMTGKELWQRTDITSALQLGYNGSPVAADGKIFAGWGDGHIFVFNARDGAILWADTLQGAIASSPAISDGRLFMATLDGYIYGFRLRETPAGISFAQSTYCFPNPVSGPYSHIQVYVTRPAEVFMTIFTMADQPVAFANKKLSAGEKFRYDWNVSRAANGVYFARILVKYAGGGEDKKTVKIAVLK